LFHTAFACGERRIASTATGFWRGTDDLLLGDFQVTLFCPGVCDEHMSSIIYLSRIVCLCVCVSQFVAEPSAILLVLIIKLTNEPRWRVWRGRDEIGKGHIGEGGCEEIFLCLRLN
jgi:hypothetical protein